MYVFAGKRGGSRGSSRGRGSYGADKPPIFIITDRGTGPLYVIPAKVADESMICSCWPTASMSRSLSTDAFRAYEKLRLDEIFDRE